MGFIFKLGSHMYMQCCYICAGFNYFSEIKRWLKNMSSKQFSTVFLRWNQCGINTLKYAWLVSHKTIKFAYVLCSWDIVNAIIALSYEIKNVSRGEMFYQCKYVCMFGHGHWTAKLSKDIRPVSEILFKKWLADWLANCF